MKTEDISIEEEQLSTYQHMLECYKAFNIPIPGEQIEDLVDNHNLTDETEDISIEEEQLSTYQHMLKCYKAFNIPIPGEQLEDLVDNHNLTDEIEDIDYSKLDPDIHKAIVNFFIWRDNFKPLEGKFTRDNNYYNAFV